MFPEQLKKILNLIKRTHDRVIIFDGSSPDDSYVIMDLDNYLDAATKPLMEAKKPVEAAKLIEAENTELSSKSAKNENLTEEDLTDKINREISMWKNQENTTDLAEENKPKKAWEISGQIKSKAQEVA